jgi:monoamine oxidase
MARTPLAGRVEELFAAAGNQLAAARPTRRQFLKRGGAAIATATLAGGVPVAGAVTGPRIVVVGGGLAGLTCVHRLGRAGYRAQRHEASDRLGGRCWTRRGGFIGGQVTERGGELIDQGHTHIRQLAQQLGLKLDNLLQAEPNGSEPFYFCDGAPYSYDEATEDLKAIWQKVHSDVSAATYPTQFDNFTARGKELDEMSIVDWIEESVPGGIRSRLGQLLDVAYNIEYGAESSEQRSLNLLYQLGYVGQGNLRIFGRSNEKYHVRGGNDQIPTRLRQALAAQIILGSKLVAMRRRSDGSYSLSFERGGATRDVVADKVVLALPFSILRSVNTSRAGFSELKRTAIAELGMGTKLEAASPVHEPALGDARLERRDVLGPRLPEHLGGEPRATRRLGPHRGLHGRGRRGKLRLWHAGGAGAAVPGADRARAPGHLGALERPRNGRLLARQPVHEGLLLVLESRAVHEVRRHRGPQGGRAYFAGEHTSVDFQDYLNGAVETGERAAGEVLADLK